MPDISSYSSYSAASSWQYEGSSVVDRIPSAWEEDLVNAGFEFFSSYRGNYVSKDSPHGKIIFFQGNVTEEESAEALISQLEKKHEKEVARISRVKKSFLPSGVEWDIEQNTLKYMDTLASIAFYGSLFCIQEALRKINEIRKSKGLKPLPIKKLRDVL